MVIISFGFLVTLYLLLVFLIFELKAWDRPESLLVIFMATTFIAPGAYFGWGEKSYSQDSVVLLNALGIYTLALSGSALLIYHRLRGNIGIRRIKKEAAAGRPLMMSLKKWYILGVSGLVIFWWLTNLGAMPIMGWFTGEEIRRPDSVPSIRHFYTFSTLLYFVLPSFYLFVISGMGKWQRIGLLAIVALLLVSGGHKGVLTYFLVFLWWFRWEKRLNLKVLMAGIGSLAVYALNMRVTRGEVYSPVETIALSTKRFFVEQARGLLARFDMVKANFNFSEFSSIKHQVAQYEWPGSTGTMPTAMFGDVYVSYGLGATLASIALMVILFFAILLVFERIEDCIVLKWSMFTFLFFAFNVELSFFSASRYLAVALNLLILTAGSFHVLKNHKVESY